ncbi:hypothetical protein BLNAU_7290 [Blattamonas nauphoetae]|uniref:Uncharacterized protein n=1 Tax=Blattamonas nauphoetae TaxID=2049346 RepID=A0ABQ9Y285_9EUKA|nr:hypothetical protein BLNAU_7290 [Blattamonas nauphoetae]
MKEEIDPLKTSDDASSNGSLDSPSTIVVNNEPFLHFDPNSKLSFEDQSTIYNSLVSLVKESYHFDNALQERAVQFLNDLEPKLDDEDRGDRLIMDLVPSSGKSHSDFSESSLTLLSSPHSTVVEATMSFLFEATSNSSPKIQDRLVESDLVSKVLTTVQPHTLPIAGNETIFDKLLFFIDPFINIAEPYYLEKLDITAAVDKYNLREKIFQKTVLPISPLVTFLNTNWHILNEDLLFSFMILLIRFIDKGPYHRPTLEFVLASPIGMTLSTYLSSVKDNHRLFTLLFNINESLEDWKTEGAEAIQSGKRMMEALISEGFEDTLEQMMMNDKSGDYGVLVVIACCNISKLLGANVMT